MQSPLKNGIRAAIALAPKLGIIKKPSFHPDGISVILPVKDEERWIKPSIMSIKDVADEIIVIDGSVEDKTPEIVAALAQADKKIKHIKFQYSGPTAIAVSCHIGLAIASYRWVLRWDADYVARSDEAMQDWRTKLAQLNKSNYYVIDLPRINMEGDLEHQSAGIPFGGWEMRIFTWSPQLKWIMNTNPNATSEQVVGDTIWGVRFPPWYTYLKWNEPYIYHCNIKSAKRELLRGFWGDYMRIPDARDYPTLEDYAKFRVQKDMNMTMEQAEKKIQEKMKKNLKLVPYDEARYGELPQVLKET